MGEFAASSRLIKPKSINRDVAVGGGGGEESITFIRKASTDVCERPPVKLFLSFFFIF